MTPSSGLSSKTAKLAHCRAPMVIGIGSHHGDDRVGWEVVDRLTGKRSTITQLYKAAVPHDLLDWLDVDTPTHIVDGSQDDECRVRRIQVTRMVNGQMQFLEKAEAGVQEVSVVLPNLRSGSTHSFELLSAIQLAAELSRLPEQLALWAVPAPFTAKHGDLSVQALEAVDECAWRIAEELAYA